MSKSIHIGNQIIGGNNPVLVQSMTNTKTDHVEETVEQILELEKNGCEMIRSTVYDESCAKAIPKIKDKIHIPFIADIHFDYKMAIAAIENGADKIRINPGNIGGKERVKAVVDCAKMHNVAIRIGVNAGSMESDLKMKYGAYSPKAMVESALRQVQMIESFGFNNLVLSLKSSDVKNTVEAYRNISTLVEYPLHVGITETGNPSMGIIKSAIGVGSLLLDGIGDTIRISLTDKPVEEIHAAYKILRSIHLRMNDIEIISCPTCGRTRVNLMDAVKHVENNVIRNSGYLKIAVMGCAVNGPGEASDADIGIAFGNNNAVIFKKGKKYTSGNMPGILDTLVTEANKMLKE